MKKHIAFLLIAIMAVSVLSAAGVVTTQTAAAQPPVSVLSATGIVTTQKTAAATSPPAVVVNYKPGATYWYAPWQFNYQYAGFDSYSGINIQHCETTGAGTAYSSIHTTQTQFGVSEAAVGMYWQLNLPSGMTWATVKNMPCKVTVTGFYVIEERGNQDTNAYAAWGLYYSPNTKYSLVNGTNLHVKSARIATTFYGTVGDLFNIDNIATHGTHQGGAGVQVETLSLGAGQASAAIVGYSVVLAFQR